MRCPPASIATAHNKLIGLFISARLITQSRLTPGRLWLPTYGRTPLTTTMWVVSRIHNRSSHRRTTPHMTRTPSFANAAVLMIYIAHLSYRCRTEDMHLALLSRWQAYQGIISLFCHKFSTRTRTKHHLAASPL